MEPKEDPQAGSKVEARRQYLAEYSRKNYATKLKHTRQKCPICEKDYSITNKWKHNSSKFHRFFKELIENRGLKEVNSKDI